MAKNIELTIFTPTYNRGELLSTLFESISIQNFHDELEWLIVDDGSSDNTAEVVNQFIEKANFPIRYFKVSNGGKHRAINFAVKEAKGKLFFIVDSDDTLTNDCVEFILNSSKELNFQEDYAGFACLRGKPNGEPILGKNLPNQFIDCSSIEFRYKKKIKGDLAEVFYTSILLQYPFIDIVDENFCSESLVWNRIGNSYKFRFYNKVTYLCEYLEGGLSYNSLKLRTSNPNYAKLNAFELSKYKIPLTQKIRAYINYWRFYFHAMNKPNKLHLGKPSLLSLVFIPIGYLMYFKDYHRLKKSNNI